MAQKDCFFWFIIMIFGEMLANVAEFGEFCYGVANCRVFAGISCSTDLAEI